MSATATEESALDGKTLAISAICLLGAAFSSLLLYQDLTTRGVRAGKPMARIERFEEGVKLKPAQSFVWNSIDADEDLYRKDSIQTSAGSGATIRFSDGTLLEMGENSLIVVDNISNLALNTMRGSLIIRSATGDKKITVDKNGKAKIEQLPVRLVKPEPLATFFVPELQQKAVDFAWQPLAKGGQGIPPQFLIEVSPDRSFRTSRTRRFSSQKGVNELSAQLGAGHWYWRVLDPTDGKNKPLTEAAQFRIDEAAALKPVYPGSGAQLQVWDEKSPIQFRWSPIQEESAGSDHYLEVSADPAFKSVALSEKIAPTSGIATVKGVPIGKLFWRLRSQYPEITVASAVEPFQVIKSARVAIELDRPADKASFELTPHVWFNWSADASNADYVLELYPSNAKPDDKPLVNVKGKTKSFDWKSPVEGAYKWRVLAYYGEQSIGDSAYQYFSIYKGLPLALKSPAKDQEFTYWTDPPRFAFSWSSDKLASQPSYSYEIDLARDMEFKSVVKSQRLKDTEVASSALGLGDGQYFWRVRVVDQTGQSVKTSDTAHFTYGVHPVLRAPASMADAPATYNPLEQEKPPVLKWSPVDDAQSYEFSLTTADKPQAKVVFRKVTKDTSVELSKNLPEGKYAWSVVAVDRLNRRGAPTPPRAFEVTYGATLGAPEATSPEVQ